MKAGWEYKKLDDICTIVGRIGFRGYTKADLVDSPNDGAITLSPSNITNGELDFSKCTYISWDKYNESPEIMLTKGDVVLVKTASIGKCAVVKELPHKATLNPQFVVLKGIIGEPNFIGYYLKSPVAQITIKQMAGGVAIPTLSQKKLGTMLIPSPPLSEQQSIVDYLDSAFAKIDAMKANAEKALNEAKALFQASLKEMLEPKEGWEEKTLLVLTSKIGSGATPKGGRKVYIDEGCHLIRSMNVQYNEFKYEDLAHITDEAAEQLKGVEIQENDVLFNITGASIARCCVVPTDALPARVNQHVSILRLKQDVLPRFLSYILNSPKHQRELLEIGEAGSTRQALTKTDLENHVICYPNIDSQIKLLYTLDSLKSKVDRLQENYNKISQECDALKQAILRQVFE